MNLSFIRTITALVLMAFTTTACGQGYSVRPAFYQNAAWGGYAADTIPIEGEEPKVKKDDPDFKEIDKEAGDSKIAYVILGIAIAGACAAAIAVPLAMK